MSLDLVEIGLLRHCGTVYTLTPWRVPSASCAAYPPVPVAGYQTIYTEAGQLRTSNQQSSLGETVGGVLDATSAIDGSNTCTTLSV